MPKPDDTARLAILIEKRAQGVITLRPFLLEIALAYPADLPTLAAAAQCSQHDAMRALTALKIHGLVTDDGPIESVLDLARQMYGGV